MQGGFPGLRDFHVCGDPTYAYNCLAFALGITTKWMWPAVAHPAPFKASLDRLFGRAGYAASTSCAGERPVAVFMRDQIYTHFAVGLDGTPEGWWESKLGHLHRIAHRFREVDCDLYGTAVSYYTRM